jgi:asparagine synthase (glutamine-hydrolysing)
MTDILAHRGPDGAGHYCEYNIGLGHRRLSILDLSDAGKQPMINSRNRYVITYNGEIYNFRELRSNLSKLGYLFRSDTDSEVLLEAFNEWGINILNKLNGMFAFAIYDRLEKKLTLARDRYGIKPLYYTVVGNTFLFASEIKAFYKHPKFSKEINLEALVEYFTFQNIFTEQTLHEKVYLLPAGHYTVVDCTKKSLSIEKTQYWDFSFEEPENPAGEDEYIEELDRLFQQAVQRQLVSDVEVGAYLSGGLDSGAISAIASKNIPNLKTFTVGFDLHSASGLELTFDEREKAEYMSYLFQTEHYEMVLKAGDMQRCMKKLIYHLEDPRVGQSYPNFYSSQLASKFVKVVLAGTGGDELFGGYPWRYYRAVINDDFEHYTDKYYKYWQRLIPNSEIWKIFAPIENNVKNVWTRDIFRNVFQKHVEKLTRPEDYVNHSLYFEAKTFLHGLLLVEDKLSMAHGLENRVPFLDNDLVDFAMKLPVKLKLGKLNEVVRINENEQKSKKKLYYQKTKDGKIGLRKMLTRHVPKEVTENIKQGFSAPDASWFKGDSIEYVKEKLFDENAKIYKYMDKKEIQRLINEHLDGKQNRRLLIWSLLNFEEWCKNI